MPSLEQFFGGARYTTSGTDTVLNWAGARVHTINMTSSGLTVTLPAANSGGLQVGGNTFILVNAGANAFTVKDGAGGAVTVIPVGESAVLNLRDAGSVAGDWGVMAMDSDGEPPDGDPPIGETLATVTAYETRTGYNLIRGTIPVPESRTPSSLFLRDEDDVAWPTEVHTVVRGPGGVPRVLELRARVDVPAPGGQRQFRVEAGNVPSEGTFHDNIVMTMLCEAPNTEADQTEVTFTSRVLNSGASTAAPGAVTSTVRTAGEMLSGTGSRLFGYEAFITTVADEPDVWLVQMSIQNGNVGHSYAPLGANGILHHVFFNEIRMAFSGPNGPYSMTHLTPTNYTTSSKLMVALSGGDAGKYHVLPQGGSKEYRFAVHTAATATRASVLLNHWGLFVCDHSKTLWSWSNPATQWYGPGAFLVPELDLSSFYPYDQTYATIADRLLNGTTTTIQGHTTTPMGPFYTRGPTGPAETGGSGITAFTGYEIINGGSVSKLKTLMAIQSMDRDREANSGPGTFVGCCIVDGNQAPIDAGAWDLSNVNAINPGQLDNAHQGPFPRKNVSQWRLTNATNAGKLPPYYNTMMGFSPYDFAHTVRGWAASTALAWLINDPLAKSHIGYLAAWGRMQNSESSQYGFVYKSVQQANANPGKGSVGGYGGRYGGWQVFYMAADWMLADDSKRSNYAPWLSAVVYEHTLNQLPSGSWHCLTSGTPCVNLDDQWTTNSHAGNPDASASQAIEIGIHGHAYRAVGVCTGDTEVTSQLAAACKGLWDYHWKPGTGAPHFVSPVRPQSDITLGAWTTRYPGTGDPYGTPGGIAPDCFTDNTDNFQIGPLVAAALEQDPDHVEAWEILEAITGETTPANIEADLLAGMPTKMAEGWGAMLAFVQDYNS